MTRTKCVFDIEADGLYREATKIHCIVIKDLQTNEVFKYYDQSLSSATDKLDEYEELIGHNIAGYDLQMLLKHMNWSPKVGVKITDTLIISKLTSPDRELPPGCPVLIPNPVTGKNDRIGPQGLHSWGYRVAKAKPVIHQWAVFNEEMLERCVSDVEINHRVFNRLLEEMKS